MCKCNFIDAYKRSLAFPTLIFPKFKITQQHYVRILCSEFHPNWTMTVLGTNVKTEKVYCGFCCADFQETGCT